MYFSIETLILQAIFLEDGIKKQRGSFVRLPRDLMDQAVPISIGAKNGLANPAMRAVEIRN